MKGIGRIYGGGRLHHERRGNAYRMTAAVIHGFILALGLILPLGVQNVFIFNQGALQRRFNHALPAVLTAAFCDSLLIGAAVLGVSVVILASAWIHTMLMLVGIGFLLYMGWTTWKSKPSSGTGLENAKPLSPRKQMAFAASVSLLNPHAIMDTIGVIGTSSLNYTGWDKAAFAVSCLAVSWLWFMGLALAGRSVGRLDKSGRFMAGLNKLSAVVMWGTAVYLAFSFL